MGIVIKIMRLLILVFSFYGYMQFVRKRVKLEFSIGIIFTAIGSMMFLAGILNIMKEVAVLICLCGIVLAIQSIYKKEKLQGVICTGTVFFGVLCIFLFFLVYGNKFLDYDNYSHWALAVKKMLNENRFPNFMDRNIMFQSYPLGSASFIYYICKIIGIRSEWMQMYAQLILMVGILISLFAFSNKWQNKLLIGAGCVLLLVGNTRLDSLLVDTLLSITALGGMILCIYYKKSIESKWKFILPYIVFLMSIKNSGIFFVAIILIYMFWNCREDKKALEKCIFILVSALSVLLVWQKHVKLVFDNGLMSKHSMSLSNFESVFGEKSQGDIIKIVSKFFETMFSVSNPVIIIFLFLILLWIFTKKTEEKTNNKKWLKNINYIIILSYFSYQIGLLGMYLFTMPLSEALDLAAYTRYHDTILLFEAGLLLIATSRIDNYLCKNSKKLKLIMVNVFCLLCIYFGVSCKLGYYQKQDIEHTTREKYDNLINRYDIQEGARYLLVRKENNDAGYLYFMSKYLLDPMVIDIVEIDDLEEDAVIGNYDYVIGWDQDEKIEKCIEKLETEQTEIVAILAAEQ